LAVNSPRGLVSFDLSCENCAIFDLALFFSHSFSIGFFLLRFPSDFFCYESRHEATIASVRSPLLSAITNNMPKVVEKSPRLLSAARNMLRAPFLGIPYHMKGCGYSTNDITDRTKQQRVRRLWHQLKQEQPSTAAPPQPSTQPAAAPGPITAEVATRTAPPAAAQSTIQPRDLFTELTNSTETINPKKIHRTSAAAQQERANKLAAKKTKSDARKLSSRVWAVEAEKKSNGEEHMTIEEVKQMVYEKYGSAPSIATIYNDVKEGRIGQSPKKTGGGYQIEDEDWLNVCAAFVSLVQINQLNTDESGNTRKDLGARIANVFGGKWTDRHLIERVLKETAIKLGATKGNRQEHRRILWNTLQNLNLWFDTWEANLLKLGFAYKAAYGVKIYDNQLHRIVNIDESALNLDNGSEIPGGRPPTVLADPSLPSSGIATSKSSSTSTIITGSNAAGEPVPPHFEFPSKAQSDETTRINVEAIAMSHTVNAKFGHNSQRQVSCTFGASEKGGMNEVRFANYIKVNFMPLYPDMKDEPGYRVILKCDSGVGRDYLALLAFTRPRMSFLPIHKPHNFFDIAYQYTILTSYFTNCTGVPNTTQTTQETDINYGPFKSAYRINHAALTQARRERDLSVSFPSHYVVLLTFGGQDPVSGITLPRNVFAEAFSVEQNKKAWAKVGAAPCTRACLTDSKISRQLGDSMKLIQDLNMRATDALTANGWNGHFLKATLKPSKFVAPVTQPHSKERI
jgi:hypothetical protein